MIDDFYGGKNESNEDLGSGQLGRFGADSTVAQQQA
jgi:hypothetical protein